MSPADRSDPEGAGLFLSCKEDKPEIMLRAGRLHPPGLSYRNSRRKKGAWRLLKTTILPVTEDLIIATVFPKKEKMTLTVFQ